MAIAGACGGCGAEIRFRFESSFVVVCDYCRAVNRRKDRDFESIGKVVDLVESESPLELGLVGSFEGLRFEITGHVQFKHPKGGFWDEWYAAFPKDKWGWLAEAQGKFYLTFEDDSAKLPAFETLELGARLALGARELVVTEISHATTAGARGEIPFEVHAGSVHPTADLEAANSVFATLDYSDATPRLFVGRQVTLADLGLEGRTKADVRADQVGARRIACPKCDGNLEIVAPDRTERMGCSYCGALLDLAAGELRFLEAGGGKLEKQLPLGAKGEFDGKLLTIIGVVERSVTFDRKYTWQEYLLYHRDVGFRWLVQSDNHWSYTEPVSAADIKHVGASRIQYCGKTFRAFQHAEARVETVLGEFYWKIVPGETVMATDYVCPPLQLTNEVSEGESQWSLSRYVPRSEVEKKFGVQGLWPPHVIAPNQPFPHKSVYRTAALFGLLAVALLIVFAIVRPRVKAHESIFDVTPRSSPDETQIFFSDEFTLKPGRNVKVTAWAEVDNSWVSLQSALFNQDTGVTRTFDLPIAWYHGVSDGESWSEGKNHKTQYLSSLPSGTYTLRVSVEREKFRAPNVVRVRVEQAVLSPMNVILLALGLFVIPVGVGIWHIAFEAQRWQGSNLAGNNSSRDDDGDDDWSE